ncbi:MAG: RNA 2',3'-cyclic phosphodiesterase [Candidatus Micrarchaeota archaeon]|nr:RNA 2',3'-cyclic phosphodiesterase [Candidatus Micrarchaeota archaeon]
MRLFVAVGIPAEIKRALGKAQKDLPEEGGLKKVEIPQMHITLKFLSDVNPRMLDRVDGVLREIPFASFRVKVRGIGVFPNDKYIRAVWAGCESPELEDLAKLVNEKLAGMFGEEEFAPHITIARVKRKIVLDDYLKKYAEEKFGNFQVNEFYLVESVLSRNGPKYTILSTYGSR